MSDIPKEYDKNMIRTRIKEIRKIRGETQQSLADKLGVQRQTIIKWEDKRKGIIPSLENLVDLCNKLNCSMDYLLGSVDTPEIEPATKVEHYSGISAEIVRYATNNHEFLTCLNFFMHPNNCAELFNTMTIQTYRHFMVNSCLEEIENPLKDELINAFDKYIATTPINEANQGNYRDFLIREFPREKINISTKKRDGVINIKACFKTVDYNKFIKNKNIDYDSFIQYLAEKTFEPLSHKIFIELQKNKLANAFISLFTKYLEEDE